MLMGMCLPTQQAFQCCFDVGFRLIWRRDVVQRNINVETTLRTSTLDSTTLDNVKSTLSISTLIWRTLGNVETTLPFAMLICTTLSHLETALWMWPLKKWKNKLRVKNIIIFLIFFSIRVFFHGHWRLTGQQGKWGDHLFFHSTTSTRLRTLRHLFATLHVRWLLHTFNRTACIYQTAIRWDLAPYQINIWLIDDVALVFVCLRVDLIFCYSNLELETSGYELASTITLVLQANRLTKCAMSFNKNHLNWISWTQNLLHFVPLFKECM